MRVAALSDVHGNLPALEAVLAQVDAAGVDAVVFGGDLVSGPWPQETLERALELGDRALFLRGNTERLVLDGASGAHRWVRDRLDRGALDVLESWPATVTLDIDGLGSTLFCHATPRSDEETVAPGSPAGRWAEALAGVREDAVVCGHTHLQFDETFAGIRVVNPGSVGAPRVRTAAWWALLGPAVDLRATAYDAPAAVEAARAAGVRLAETFAEWLLAPRSYEETLVLLGARE